VIFTIFTLIFWDFTEFNEKLWDFTKVNKSYSIPQYFLGQITHFCSVSFNCDVLLGFCDFILWQWNFSVCYHTVLPLGNIGKYFAIVKQKVIFPISQILNWSFFVFNFFIFTNMHMSFNVTIKNKMFQKNYCV